MSETDDINDKTTTPADPVSRLTGRVKWFNNKTGFGFITALTESDSVKKDSDVFVHHSAVKVSQEQYRYLVQGEYVEFVLSKLTASSEADAAASKHEFQAVDVSGVKGGKLICETRWESRSTSGSGAGFSAAGSGSSGASRFSRSNEGSGAGSSEWTTVGGPRKSSFVPRQGSGEWRSSRGDSSGRGRGRGGRGGAGDGHASSE